ATAQSDDLQALLAERLEGGYKATSSARLLIAVSGLLMTVTVFFGISALTVLSVIAVPAIACLGGYSVW
ncbi:Cytosine permease protein, partial [human gut metagenome]